MQNEFHIGRRKRLPKRRISGILLVLFCTLLALLLWINFALLPQVRALCTTAISNRFESLANENAYRILKEGEYTYEDFIRLSVGTGGEVRAASFDTVKLNLLKTELATRLLSSLSTQSISAAVPVGNLMGLIFFSGTGKDIKINARLTEGVTARFQTSFTEAGINQTRHAIGISLIFTANYFLSTGTETLKLTVDIPIGETLIVGDVPDTLTQINRLTDDVTEIDIDDAVDFGNVLS